LGIPFYSDLISTDKSIPGAWLCRRCSIGLSATSQQYFSLRTNQPPATSQQYSHQPAVLFSQNKPTTSNQPAVLFCAVLFSQNKPAPATSHQPTELRITFLPTGYTRKQGSDIFGTVQCTPFPSVVKGNVKRTLI
jgi:hypothetical protein